MTTRGRDIRSTQVQGETKQLTLLPERGQEEPTPQPWSPPKRCACEATFAEVQVWDDCHGKWTMLPACPRERCFQCGDEGAVRVFHMGRWTVACNAHRHAQRCLPDVAGGGGNHLLWSTPAEVRAFLQDALRFDRHAVTVRVVTAMLAALPQGRWEVKDGGQGHAVMTAGGASAVQR